MKEYFIINIRNASHEAMDRNWIEGLKSYGLNVNVELKPHSTEIETIKVFMYTVKDYNDVINYLKDVYLIDSKDRWLEKDGGYLDSIEDNFIDIWLEGFN